MNGLHIAVDALFRLPEGAGRTHLEQVLAAWRDGAPYTNDRISVFTTPSGAEALRNVAGGNVTLRAHTWPGKSVLRRVIWEQVALPGAIRRARSDVLLCPGNMIPLAASVPIVVILQTIAPFCPDAPFRARMVGQLMRLSARGATHVICVSETMRNLAVTRFGIDPARVSVIRYGLTPPQITDPVQVVPVPYSFPYLLCVGAIRRYKHLAELIDGYAQAMRAMPACDWHLVLAGHAHDRPYAAELHAQVEHLKLHDRVIFIGGVAHETIKALLRHALALIQPSACESFGLPLLEAMTAGVPIACSHIPASVEVVGDAALIFDPNDPATIAAQLIKLSDPAVRQGLIERGRARLSTFGPWSAVAAQTRDVLLTAVHESA
ncbi:MAG: glycosyltransferase family 4 protein [Aggregatilineales bacterium]